MDTRRRSTRSSSRRCSPPRPVPVFAHR
jgi:hypothetical protein